jgi:hypothetical protein
MAIRQQLYSILPELQDIDTNIGPVIVQTSIDNIKDIYFSVLSNSVSFDDLFIENPNIVFNYIRVLENQLMIANMPNRNSNIASLVTQKISILENAYSNLVQSSTQSTQ